MFVSASPIIENLWLSLPMSTASVSKLDLFPSTFKKKREKRSEVKSPVFDAKTEEIELSRSIKVSWDLQFSRIFEILVISSTISSSSAP